MPNSNAVVFARKLQTPVNNWFIGIQVYRALHQYTNAVVFPRKLQTPAEPTDYNKKIKSSNVVVFARKLQTLDVKMEDYIRSNSSVIPLRRCLICQLQ